MCEWRHFSWDHVILAQIELYDLNASILSYDQKLSNFNLLIENHKLIAIKWKRTVRNKHLNIGKPLSVRPLWKLALKRLKNKFDWGHESINLKSVHHCCSRINWQCFIHHMKLSSINRRLWERKCIGKNKITIKFIII